MEIDDKLTAFAMALSAVDFQIAEKLGMTTDEVMDGVELYYQATKLSFEQVKNGKR